MRHPQTVFHIAAMCAAAISLSGCVGVSVTAQERPFFRALDDFNARTELNARLLAEDPALFANVSTTVIEGRVHLAGTVNTPEQRMKAAQIAWASPNVKEVVNSIEVTRSGGIIETAGDRWISGQVRARILADDEIRDSNYSIDTQNNVVYIMGIAQNTGELDRVLKHAAVVPGVRQVVNYAVMKDDPRRFTPIAMSSDPYTMRPVDDERVQQTKAAPPVLTNEPQQGYAASGPRIEPTGRYTPQPVEVTPLEPAPAGNATGAPRVLIR